MLHFMEKKREIKTVIAPAGYKLILSPNGQTKLKSKWGGTYFLKLVPAGTEINDSTTEEDKSSAISLKVNAGTVGAELTTDGNRRYNNERKIVSKNDYIDIEYVGSNFFSKVVGKMKYVEIEIETAGDIYTKWKNSR